MSAGAFRFFAHDHHFEIRDGRTVMTDILVFQSPFGLLGRLVDSFFMTRYLRRLIERRCRAIKHEAEAAMKTASSIRPGDRSATERRETGGEDRRKLTRVTKR
jgi:hypothetical protein